MRRPYLPSFGRHWLVLVSAVASAVLLLLGTVVGPNRARKPRLAVHHSPHDLASVEMSLRAEQIGRNPPVPLLSAHGQGPTREIPPEFILERFSVSKDGDALLVPVRVAENNLADARKQVA